jgi:hypothetical protein
MRRALGDDIESKLPRLKLWYLFLKPCIIDRQD